MEFGEKIQKHSKILDYHRQRIAINENQIRGQSIYCLPFKHLIEIVHINQKQT